MEGSDGLLTPGEHQARRVYSAGGTWPTLAARKSSGQDQQSVLYGDGDAPWFEGERRPDFKYHLRRLMPVECERLQGFPDGWTDVEYRGRPARDTPRYKALGNSMAVPCMRWIGERIQMVDDMIEGKEDPNE